MNAIFIQNILSSIKVFCKYCVITQNKWLNTYEEIEIYTGMKLTFGCSFGIYDNNVHKWILLDRPTLRI